MKRRESSVYKLMKSKGITESKASKEILSRIKSRAQKRSKKTDGAWGRTKKQLNRMWSRSHKLNREDPIKSMREVDNFNGWLKKIQNDEKNKKRKPKWAAY
jgi:hypothetical protein